MPLATGKYPLRTGGNLPQWLAWSFGFQHEIHFKVASSVLYLTMDSLVVAGGLLMQLHLMLVKVMLLGLTEI